MSKKTKQQKHQERLEEKEKHDLEHVEHEAHLHEDDLVVAPKGMSRRKFIFTLAVTVAMVVAFTLTGPIMSALSGGGPGEREYVTWNHPTLGKTSINQRDFLAQKQDYNRLLSSILSSRGGVTDEDTAAYILEDELAKQAGVVLTDVDLENFLRDQLGFTDVSILRDYSRSMGMTTKKFEAEMRRWLRVRRYRNLMGQALQFADTAEVESKWRDQFREYKFVFVEADTEDFDSAARAIVPEDAELETWFAGLQDFKRNQFRTERKMAAEFAVVKFDASDLPAGLLEKFPLEEDADLESVQRNYYDLVSSTRFQRASSEEAAEGEEPATETIPYEEVTEACAKEAPVYYAMHEWLTSIGPIAADPAQTIDFGAVASELGLEFVSNGEARTESEWAELEEVFGTRLSGMLRYAPSGNFLPTVLISADAVVVARCTAVEEPRLPEFADIRDEVVDSWVEEKRADVALESLTTIYKGFIGENEEAPAFGGVEVEDEVFGAALIAAGLEQTEREWRDRIQPPPGGFVDAAPVELYLRANPAVYVLADGRVAEPGLDRTREHAYLLRMVGSRDPELVEMKPAYVKNIEGQVINSASTDFVAQAFGFAAYAEEYDLELHPAVQN